MNCREGEMDLFLLRTGFLNCCRQTAQLCFFVFSSLCLVSTANAQESAPNNPYPYITTTIPVSGYVKKLVVLKRTPNLLYALVQNDGPPKVSDRTGLYIFDISNPAIPKLLTIIPITSPIGLDITRGESWLFVYSAWYQGHDPKGWYGVSALDISNPMGPHEIGKTELDITYARTSADDKRLFVIERGLTRKNEEGYRYTDYSVGADGNLSLATRVRKQDLNARDLAIYTDGGYLLSADKDKTPAAFDSANPSVSKEAFNNLNNIGYPHAIGPDGTVYLLDGDDLVLASLFPKVQKKGVLPGRFSSSHIGYISEDSRSAYVLSLDKTLHILDLSNPAQPKTVAQYVMPNYIGSAVPSRRNGLIYAGLLGSIVVIDPSRAVVTSERLIAAHAEALRQYRRTDLKFDFERTRNAINVLKAAGIADAQKKKPDGMSDKVLASILNDYGFFLDKANFLSKEATDVYREVIKLDPTRSVAYLNLGDNLRGLLRTATSFQEKQSLTKEIKTSYMQYRQRSGKSTAEVDSFMSLNIVDKPPTDFCEYVAAYANRRRLVEIFGSGESVERADGQGRMRIDITDQGTAHIPWLRVFDNETNQELAEGTMGIPAESEETRWAQNIAVVPYKDGHHLLYFNDGNFLISTAPVGVSQVNGKSCGFATQVVESFDKVNLDPKLCQLVMKNRPPYIETDGFHSLTNDALQKAGYSETSFGKALKVDFDNDGIDDYLVSLQYASGAGRGCDYSFFDLLNSRRDGFSASKGRELLQEMQGTGRQPARRHDVPLCSGNTTGWFRYNGIVYYETKYPGDEPKVGSQEFHRVSYIKGGTVKTVCDASFAIQTTVQH